MRDTPTPAAFPIPADWTLADLRYELARQQAPVVSTWGRGMCGHNARGSGYCGDCLRAELERRNAG